MEEDTKSLWLRCGEVAKLLNLSRAQVYLMAQSGELPAIRVGRAVRIDREALDGWRRKKLAEHS